jgi:hypothetical protein
MKLGWSLACLVAGLLLLATGLLIPAHLRAVDVGVIQSAGRRGPALLGEGQVLMAENRLGTAQLLFQAARIAGLAGGDSLETAADQAAKQNPIAYFWGNDSRVFNVFEDGTPADDDTRSLTDFIVQQRNREAALARLQESQLPVIQELWRSRSLNNTVLFPPSQSAAGQAYDTAVSICGLLLEGRHLTAGLSNNILTLASAANHGASSQPLEQVLMDFLSLGVRFNWDQLTSFAGGIPDVETLHQLTNEAQKAGDQLPVLFAAVQLSGNASGVAKYTAGFPASSLPDLSATLRYGSGGINSLLEFQHRYYKGRWQQSISTIMPLGGFYHSTASLTFNEPVIALVLKWLCYGLAGFFLAAAFHHARPASPPLERPLQVPGIHWFREFLFSLGFLLVVLLLSEPFLAQENLKGNFTLRLSPPTTGGAVPAGIASIKQLAMNPVILLTLLIFFVLQALLYLACLVKLGEIRRQQIPSRMKLKLLENEDHLFDAGLYLGFVGTIVSLIVASMGLVKFSLMAAYSSTSFGIIFVVIFKIFHLRPARRQLLLEAEANSPEAQIPVTPPTPVLPS